MGQFWGHTGTPHYGLPGLAQLAALWPVFGACPPSAVQLAPAMTARSVLQEFAFQHMGRCTLLYSMHACIHPDGFTLQ